VNALQVKLCDPRLGALKWFVYHAKRYASVLHYLCFFTFSFIRSVRRSIPTFTFQTLFVLSLVFSRLDCVFRLLLHFVNIHQNL